MEQREEKLSRDFYQRDGITLAKELLGMTLVRVTEKGKLKARIVETEAYMGEQDAAAHSYKKRNPTGRTNIQYGAGGYAYIYLIYGMYSCLNVVANKEGIPECVLIRALEPLEGIEIMEEKRRTEKFTNLCSGPGKLCQAMDIDRSLYGEDLCGEVLYIEKSREAVEPSGIVATPRINIAYAGEAAAYPWRFILKDNPCLSVREKCE